MTNNLSFTDVEVQVEDYIFLIIRVSKNYEAERFSLRIKNGSMCFFNIYNNNSGFFLFPGLSNTEHDNSLIYALDERKDFLIKLYNAIRNHPSLRLKLLHLLGPIKQY